MVENNYNSTAAEAPSAARMTFADYYLLFCIYLLPSKCLGMIDHAWFYGLLIDYHVVTIMLTSLLFLYPANKFTSMIPGIFFMKVICGYILFKTAASLAAGIPFAEVAAVLRINIFHPFCCLAILHAAGSRPAANLRKIFRIILVLFGINLAQLALSSLFGLELCLIGRPKEFDEQSLESLRANMNLLPVLLDFAFAFTLIYSGRRNAQSKRMWLYPIAIMITVFSLGIRNFAIKISFRFVLVFLLVAMMRNSFKSHYVKMFLTVLLLLIIGGSVVGLNQFWRAARRYDVINISADSMRDNISYKFRQHLFELALEILEKEKCTLTGNGYMKDIGLVQGRPMYCIALGRDNSSAAILWCEGYIGIVLRLMPYVMMLCWSIRSLFSREVDPCYRNGDISLRPVIALSCIVLVAGEILCYAFTTALTNPQYDYGMLGLLFIYDAKLRSEDTPPAAD